MIGAAIIALREAFEAALIIGLVLAGTRGVPHRGRWVVCGALAGVVGAAVVAAFAGRLAEALEGVGQEFFNAGVLLLAAALLGWHNVWMKRHGRQMAADMHAVGRDVRGGTRPLSMLALVVALAVLREGAELVLFLYGIAIGGTGAGALELGAGLGLLAGAGLGAALYLGLVAIPQRSLFAVTTVLLLLVAAGMASQAAGFLVQAGALPPLADPLWNSAALLREHSVVGQALHALIGYAERPSGMQILCFVLTAVTITLWLRFADRRPLFPGAAGRALLWVCLVGAAAGLAPPPALAGLVVYSPVVEGGERAVELRLARDADGDPTRNGAEEHKLEVEYAPTDWWLTEALVTVSRDPGGTREATELAWENVLALAPQGKYWADVGVLVEYAHARRSDGRDALELGLLGEKTFGSAILTVNLTAEQALAAGERAELGYSARLRYHRRAVFEPGVEVFGSVGAWGEFGSLRTNRLQAGPSATGRLRLAGRQALRYDVAWVFGLTPGSPDSTARVQLEYEF